MIRSIAVLLILLLATAPVMIPGAQEQDNFIAGPVLTFSQPVTSGTVLKEYSWTTAGRPVKAYVIEVNLKDPYVRIEAIAGAGKLTQRLNVSAMASVTGAVSAVNGDFFNTQGEGAPVGPMFINGSIVSSPAYIEGIYSLGITKERKAYIEPLGFEGKATAPNGNEYVISGINKTVYWEDPGQVHSHANKLHLYNDLWGGVTRGNDSYTTPTEMLIRDGKVITVVSGKYIDSQVPDGMEILRGHGSAARFLTENFAPGDDVRIEYKVTPSREWSMVIGGHGLLVDKGSPVAYTKPSSSLSGARARTAAGINSDGTVLYLIGIENGTVDSKGLTIAELSLFCSSVGIYKAVNLDGGGSTTMVSRELGEWETEKVFPTEQPGERMVVNAIGIYTTAPGGALKGLMIRGEKVLLVGEQADYTINAYDEYYNPVHAENLLLEWKASGAAGIIDSRFTGLMPGAGMISVVSGNVKSEYAVEIAGKENIAEMRLTGPDRQVVNRSEIPLKLSITTESGNEKQINPANVEWQFYGFKGHVSEEGVLTIDEKGSGNTGFIVAGYRDFWAPMILRFAYEKAVMKLDSLDGISFQVYPQGISGSLSLTADPDGGGDAVVLDYDFSAVSGTAAAYMKLDGDGEYMDSNVQSILLDVYGDGGGQWLRAEIADSRGVVHKLDLSTKVDWSGWKTVELALQGKSLSFPLYLKRIYVVCEQGERGFRALSGSLLLKELRFSYKTGYASPKARTLELTIGQKEIKVDGVSREMDVSPVIINNRTLVPIRFISESLGAGVTWNGDTKKVTIIYDLKWIDLWAGENRMVVNGKAIYLDVAPQIINGRTMLPLRFVAESLGLTVQWDQKTRNIMLR